MRVRAEDIRLQEEDTDLMCVCVFQSRISLRSSKEGRKSSSIKLQDEAEDHTESIVEGGTYSGEAEGWKLKYFHTWPFPQKQPWFFRASGSSFLS